MFTRPGRAAECPIDASVRAWIDERMDWLLHVFGAERLRSARVILPTAEFFPDPYSGSEDDVRVLLDRVCGYMGIDPATTELALYDDPNRVSEGAWHGTSGLYQEHEGKFRIWIEASNLGDPLALVATAAHELGHVLLLGHGRIPPDTEDHEPLTDLLTVFLGLGVITANAVVRESHGPEVLIGRWSISRRGYLTMPLYGYALALFARHRGEERPAWARRLRPDVRAAFHQALRFLADPSAAAPPEVRPAVPTMARPEVSSAPAEDLGEGADPCDLPEDGRARCVYCGTELGEHAPRHPARPGEAAPEEEEASEAPPVCRECQLSIEENRREREAEQRARDADDQRAHRMSWTTWGLLAAGALLALVLSAFH